MNELKNKMGCNIPLGSATILILKQRESGTSNRRKQGNRTTQKHIEKNKDEKRKNLG